MKTENNLQNEIVKTNDEKKRIDGMMIVETVAKFLQKYGRILLIAVASVIVIIAGVLAYFAWNEAADDEYNVRLEQGISAYMSASSAQSQEQLQSYIAMASEAFRNVMDNAKNKQLKLRAEYELASVLFDSKNFLDAARMYGNVSQNRGFYLVEPALYNKAIAEIEQQKYDEAIATLESFRKLYPKSYLFDDATLTLANTLYTTKNQNAQAIEMLKTWVAANDEDSAYMPTVVETLTLMESGIY